MSSSAKNYGRAGNVRGSRSERHAPAHGLASHPTGGRVYLPSPCRRRGRPGRGASQGAYRACRLRQRLRVAARRWPGVEGGGRHGDGSIVSGYDCLQGLLFIAAMRPSEVSALHWTRGRRVRLTATGCSSPCGLAAALTARPPRKVAGTDYGCPRKLPCRVRSVPVSGKGGRAGRALPKSATLYRSLSYASTNSKLPVNDEVSPVSPFVKVASNVPAASEVNDSSKANKKGSWPGSLPKFIVNEPVFVP